MPSAHPTCHLGFFEYKNAAVAALWTFLSCLIFAASAQAQVTLLVPSQPSVEAPAPRPKAEAPAKREDKKDDKRPTAKEPEEETAPEEAAPTEPKKDNLVAPQPKKQKAPKKKPTPYAWSWK